MEDLAVEIKILDYLQGRLSETERREMEYLRKTSPAFDARFNEVKQVWEGLDLREVPEMGPSVRTDFQAMLKTFELEHEHSKTFGWNDFLKKIAGAFVYRPKYNWAYAILLVCFGAFITYIILNPRKDFNSESIAERDNKTQMMLTMLQDPAAVERMRGVSYVEGQQQIDDKVIDALLTTLNVDENENVRLVTLDALIDMAENPKVREGLVNSIVKQKSELMQVAMANAMLRLQEKKSVKPLKKLLEDQDSGNALIKEKLEQTVQKLESI